MVSHSSQPRRAGRKTIVIGFDFGTHSTKVVARQRGSQEGRIIEFDEPPKGYLPHSSPSLVRSVAGRLFFGSEALRRETGELKCSLKVRLLANKEHETSSREDDQILVACYFAWAFQRVLERLRDPDDTQLFLNVAAPMSSIEDPQLKDRYLRILQAAWMSSLGDHRLRFSQGIEYAKAKAHLQPLLRKQILSREVRRFEVLPETIAPVVSLSLDPLMESGMYAIVDTGAGTTEVTVFHAGDTGADQKVVCYRDETIYVGGNDVACAERGKGEYSVADIVARIEKKYRRVWHLGYSTDSPNHRARQRWSELNLVLSGGGTLHETVSSRLIACNPMHPWPVVETRLKHLRHAPASLKTPSRLGRNDASMYAVANGLAVERRLWPEVYEPNEIAPLDPTEEVADKPLGYWYLD